MTPEGPAHAQYRNRGAHTCPFPGRAPRMCGAGAKWGPTAIWGIFLYVTDFYLSYLCWEYIFTSVTYNLTGVFFYGSCASLCFSNKNLKSKNKIFNPLEHWWFDTFPSPQWKETSIPRLKCTIYAMSNRLLIKSEGRHHWWASVRSHELSSDIQQRRTYHTDEFCTSSLCDSNTGVL